MSLKLITLALAAAFSLGVSTYALAAPAKAKPVAKTKPAPVPESNDIEFAHQLSAGDAGRLAVLVERFNSQQAEGDLHIRLTHAEAGRKKPALLNLVTSGAMANFLANKSAFKPVYQVLKENGESLASGELSADLLAGEKRDRLNALPVAFSTPVLFYNKRLFRQAGLDPDAPPKTWHEMQEIAGALMDHGIGCPYTSSWPTWVHIDNMSAVSGALVADNKGKLSFNGLPQVKHIAMLSSWHKARYFQTFGRGNEADSHFYSGECAMLTSDAWANSTLRDAPGVELGVAPLPYHDDIYGARPGHTLAAGAALWVGAGYKAKDYQVAARFIRFLLAPDVQIALARTGGFLPLTETARNAIRSKLLKDEEQALDVAYASLQGRGAEQTLRVSTLDPVRIIVDEELEQVWANKKPAKAALDTAVKRGNSVLSAKPALKKVLSF
ncbi:sn-glycerol-3-phosphate ABC transporter substrate-binding protein [Betaproteobacteria bacterium]|nr:sn-glycerol-3-phosphate ABC transporter substrate-binding protein [Betaproteobacteria bacterium]GHU48910.1 sn-glycerol-3-phosphate ABC transporter substrate-binding protein [Betaproteobacteria bacterium]